MKKIEEVWKLLENNFFFTKPRYLSLNSFMFFFFRVIFFHFILFFPILSIFFFSFISFFLFFSFSFFYYYGKLLQSSFRTTSKKLWSTPRNSFLRGFFFDNFFYKKKKQKFIRKENTRKKFWVKSPEEQILIEVLACVSCHVLVDPWTGILFTLRLRLFHQHLPSPPLWLNYFKF